MDSNPLKIYRMNPYRLLLFPPLILFTAFTGCFQSSSTVTLTQRPSLGAETRGSSQSAAFSELPRASSPTPLVSRYAPIMRAYSQEYGVDWLLVLAVMNRESRFDKNAVSSSGAYGLMQIMPMTQIELTEKLGVDEAVSPRNNIKAGVYHLAWLYRYFKDSRRDDRIKLTLAAYNAGLERVIDARRIARYLGNDPAEWVSVKNAFPLLSSRSYSLHQRIWADGKPMSGYMRHWSQTVAYAEDISRNYDALRTTM